MNLDNLCQYNTNLFLDLLGKYICQQRLELQLSHQDLSATTKWDCETWKKIEAGQYHLSNEEFLEITDRLSLEESSILSLAKITQVQSIIEVTRELNADFP